MSQRPKKTNRQKERLAATSLNLESAAAKVSNALRLLATAASSQLGADCYLHTLLGQALLADLGIQTNLVAGYAAWRVGDGDGDVLSHMPNLQSHLPSGTQGFAYHSWLECGRTIVDLTTYQFTIKAQQLDAADGGKTSVIWHPNVLMLKPEEIRSYREVAQSPHAGVAFYKREPAVEKLLAETQEPLDAEDLHVARWLLSNPDTNVFGPNDRQQLGERT